METAASGCIMRTVFRIDSEVADPLRKNAGKTRGRPFERGNPGRPKGAQNRTTRLIEALLEGEAEAIGRKCIERAKEGDPVVWNPERLAAFIARAGAGHRDLLVFQLDDGNNIDWLYNGNLIG